MFDSISIYHVVFGASCSIAVYAWLKLYPKPYAGIPYNAASAKRILGDMPDLIPLTEATNEFSMSMVNVTTRKLGKPIAQILFPNIRKPLIVLDDAREIEDIMIRRNKEFDKADMLIGIIKPMFPLGSLSQKTTPELKMQKRIWADVMGADFLRKTAAPNIYKSALELVDLWRLKASTIHKDQPFDVQEDFKDAALDAIWAAIVGEEAGTTRSQIKKLRNQVAGMKSDDIAGSENFVKQAVEYMTTTIASSSSSPVPHWVLTLETYTLRYRRFRRIVSDGVGEAMKKAVDRFQKVDLDKLETDDLDTCAIDLLLRRQVLAARKSGVPMADPTKDQRALDETFVMLVGGHDSTAHTLAFFVTYMEMYPVVQQELRAALNSVFPGPELPSVDEIVQADIPYLDGVCEETVRLATTAGAALRQAIVDTEILGCKVPKGAEILMNLNVSRPPLPIDESVRSETSRAAAEKHGDGFQGPQSRDLGVLEPRRWLKIDENTGKEAFNPSALPSIVFGGGYRGCFGRKLATMELRIMIVLLILNLEFHKIPEGLSSEGCHETIFRSPDTAYAKLKILRT